MWYECPFCSSKRQPKIIDHYPPPVAKCKDCNHEDLEKKFVHEKEIHGFHPVQ